MIRIFIGAYIQNTIEWRVRRRMSHIFVCLYSVCVLCILSDCYWYAYCCCSVCSCCHCYFVSELTIRDSVYFVQYVCSSVFSLKHFFDFFGCCSHSNSFRRRKALTLLVFFSFFSFFFSLFIVKYNDRYVWCTMIQM